MKKIPPKARFSKHAKAKEVPESLILEALTVFGFDPRRTSVKILSGGFMNGNYRVDDDNTSRLMRIYSTDMKTAELEKDILKFAKKKSIKVPEVAGLKKIQDRPVAIHQYIEGLTLEDALIAGFENHDSLFKELGAQLAKIHEINFLETGFLGPNLAIGNEYKSFGKFAKEFIEKTLKKISENKLSKEIKGRILQLVKDKWQMVLDTEPATSLCHCDFNPKNLMVTHSQEPNLAAVLDWEFCLSGNGLIDIGNFFRFAYDYTHGAEQSFIKGYSSVKKLDEYWPEAAKLIDLGSMCSFLESGEDYPETFRTARAVIENTLHHFNY